MTPGNPMVYVRYDVTVANGNDTPETLDDIEMEGSFLTTRTTRNLSVSLGPHVQRTVTFAANGFTEAPAAHPVTREASGYTQPPLKTGPPSMLIIIHVSDKDGRRGETFEQAIAGR